MAFLIVAGITMKIGEGERGEPIVVGSDSRAFDGSLRTTVRTEKGRWSFTTVALPQATIATVRAAIAGGVHVTVSGDAIGASITARVFDRGGPYVYDRGQASGARERMRLEIEQV